MTRLFDAVAPIVHARTRIAVAATLALAISAGPSQAAPRGGFAEFEGSWTGSGRVESASGSEAIRCRARYDVGEGGGSIAQHLVCASASYRFDIECRAADAGGKVSGTWSETTRGVSGTLSGALNGGRLQAVVDAPLFSASLSLATHGKTQEVVISPRGNDVKQVSIRLRRG